MRPRPWAFALIFAAAALAHSGCADPSEVSTLRAKKAGLEAERARLQQLSADAALYRDAMKQAPEAGRPLDAAEATARVTRMTAGVAVSVERTAGGGLDLSLSGPASPERAAVALVQLSSALPDLSLRQASLRPDGFSARGSVERPGPPSVPAAAEHRTLIPLTQARALRDEVARLEREVQAEREKVGPELAERGPAALAAVQSPDRFRQQAKVAQLLVSGASPLAAAADLTFAPALISARGTLSPGKKVLDAVPLFKADYDVQSLSENGGRFELKLAPRATGR
ncbi:MAG TPA: hypothetical protein VND93_18765 [Myxococcales bacterium]|nr:hypothetical protein [Myxococcales bacterium]